MKTLQLYQGSSSYHRAIRIGLFPAAFFLCAIMVWLTHLFGDMGYAFAYAMLIPISLAAFTYGVRGGLLFAFVSGIAVVLFLPLHLLGATQTELGNWLFLMAVFLLVGGLGGLASDVIQDHLMRIRSLARHDMATGLPNVHALLMALEKLARSKNCDASHILGVVTVYNSGEMSSAFGFSVMDQSMQKLATCATVCLPQGAATFRIGSEQIGFLSQVRESEILTLLSRLNTSFRQPLIHQSQPIHADTRIGYVVISGFQEEPESYLRKAQAASLQASQSGHDISLYQSGIRNRARDNLTILGELIGGMERKEVFLHYQPKVSLHTGAVVGAEALIRWQHPQRGLLPPAAFIQRAEQSTLIHALTEFVIENALRQAVTWHAAGMEIPIAVNVSPRNLMQPGLYRMVLRSLACCKAKSELLELEVTEGAMISDIDMVASELHQLNDFGVKIAIDDFGTGYSSINHLDRLPASSLKIDQSFVRRMLSEDSSLDVVDAIVSVAHKKGVEIVAEGVESQAVFDILRELGCDVAQGYAIGKPMPPEEFRNWYHNWNSINFVQPVKSH